MMIENPLTHYVRCGDRIHKESCRYANLKTSPGAVAWAHVAGCDDGQVQGIVNRVPWLELCKVCWSEGERNYG